MSVHLGLVHHKVLGNRVHCTFILSFLRCCSLRNFAHSYISRVPNTNIICTDIWFQVFQSNTKNQMVSSNYFYLIIVISLYIAILFQLTYMLVGCLGFMAYQPL